MLSYFSTVRYCTVSAVSTFTWLRKRSTVQYGTGTKNIILCTVQYRNVLFWSLYFEFRSQTCAWTSGKKFQSENSFLVQHSTVPYRYWTFFVMYRQQWHSIVQVLVLGIELSVRYRYGTWYRINSELKIDSNEIFPYYLYGILLEQYVYYIYFTYVAVSKIWFKKIIWTKPTDTTSWYGTGSNKWYQTTEQERTFFGRNFKLAYLH